MQVTFRAFWLFFILFVTIWIKQRLIHRIALSLTSACIAAVVQL